MELREGSLTDTWRRAHGYNHTRIVEKIAVATKTTEDNTIDQCERRPLQYRAADEVSILVSLEKVLRHGMQTWKDHCPHCDRRSRWGIQAYLAASGHQRRKIGKYLGLLSMGSSNTKTTTHHFRHHHSLLHFCNPWRKSRQC